MKTTIVCLLLCGCGATSNEPCTQADLSKIVAHHEAELALACAGQGSNCYARKELDAKFREQVRGWVRCDEETKP